jgi:transposase
MARSGPRKVARYSEQFKATAVKLSRLPEVLIQDVAVALDIHPFMLSRWRKQAGEGMIVTRGVKLDVDTSAELKRLRQLERRYKVLKEEHELLKKAIRFASERKRKSSPSSKPTGVPTKLRWCAVCTGLRGRGSTPGVSAGAADARTITRPSYRASRRSMRRAVAPTAVRGVSGVVAAGLRGRREPRRPPDARVRHQGAGGEAHLYQPGAGALLRADSEPAV